MMKSTYLHGVSMLNLEVTRAYKLLRTLESKFQIVAFVSIKSQLEIFAIEYD